MSYETITSLFSQNSTVNVAADATAVRFELKNKNCLKHLRLTIARVIAVGDLNTSWKLEQLLVTCEACLIAVGNFSMQHLNSS